MTSPDEAKLFNLIIEPIRDFEDKNYQLVAPGLRSTIVFLILRPDRL